MNVSRLGDILLKQKRISREQLDLVLRGSKLHGDTMTAQLIRQNIFDERELVKFMARSFGCPVIDLDKIKVDAEVINIPVDVLRKHMVLPLKRTGNVLKLAVIDPYNINGLDEISFISGCKVEVIIASEKQLNQKLDELSDHDSHLQKVMDDLGAMDVEVIDTSEEDIDEYSLSAEVEAAPVVKLVNLILMDAIRRGASDIHLEPYEKVLRVRYRIDGVLHEIMRPNMSMRDAIVSRLKILARLDISERRLPQDGRIKLRLSRAKTVDFRVSVLPTLFGEKVVMRLLDPSSLQLDMTKLGYDAQSLKWLKSAIHQPYGMVLVTGPTGSGKTVSLYSAVSELNQPGVNISTAEDPVEFNFMGIKSFLVGSAINLISAQRLARCICPDCKTAMQIPAAALLDAGVSEEDVIGFQAMIGKGCQTCNGTGSKGRTGIYQVMPVFDEIREAVYAGENSDVINAIAVSKGVKTLRMAALEKVNAGEISLEECLRVTVAN